MPPTLDCPGLLLRPPEIADAAAIAAAVQESMATVGRWMGWCHAGYGLPDASGWIAACNEHWAAGTEREFVLLDQRSGELVGCAGLNGFNTLHRFANLGYWIRAGRAGQGLATAAARRIARFGFERLALARIEIVAQPGNLPSRRVAEKTGAAFEGVLRHRLIHRGEPFDAAMYSLLPSDLAAGPAA